MRIKAFKSRLAERGFSLVELMVVVAIIGILAALAVPKFQNFQAKAKQSEAKNNLSHIYTLEQSYYGDSDTFTTSTTDIGFNTSGGKVRYAYSVSGAGQTTFTGDAKATTTDNIAAGCGTNDEWTIDQSNNLAVVAGKNCANK